MFENQGDRIVPIKYYPLNVEIEEYNVMVDGKNFFNQPVNNNMKTNDNIQKLQQVKEMIRQLVVSWTKFISKNIRW